MPEDGLTMRKYAVIAIIITLSMIICPFAATGKKKASTQEVISAISVIEAEDGGEYISVMSADSEIRKLEMREYLIGCVAAEMPAEPEPAPAVEPVIEPTAEEILASAEETPEAEE